MLVANKYFGTDLLVSPLSGRQPPAFNNGKIIGETDYVYMAGLDGDCDQNCVVAYERPENYGGKETAVAYLDGHVSKVDVTTLEQQLARTKAEIAKVAARRASSPH